MIGKQTHNHALVVQEFSLEKNQTVKHILVFIKSHLPEFENLFRQSQFNFTLEDEISKELLRFLNDKARTENLLFQFNEKKGVDFTVFLAYPFKMGASSIFMIEAKRLDKDKRDYVFGRTGGLERIKREQDQFGKHLSSGAMLGYIQSENRLFWENRINFWIDDLISKQTDLQWNSGDKLHPNTEFADYSSLHQKISGNSITLFHYWINLT